MYKQIPDNHYHTSKIISHHTLYFLRIANIPNQLSSLEQTYLRFSASEFSTVTLGDGGLQRRGDPKKGGGAGLKRGGSYPSPHCGYGTVWYV